MSQLLDLRQAVIARLKTKLQGFSIEGHLGRFTAAELDKFLTTAPAVRVAILGLSETTDQSDDEGTVLGAVARLAVYVVTKDGADRLGRDEAAIAAVETICLEACGQRWGVPFARPARPATAQNLYSADTLAKGRALWAIDIPQPVRLETEVAALDPLTEIYVGMAPEIGAAHVDDYAGPIPEVAGG